MTMAGILAQRAFYAQTGMHVQMRLVRFHHRGRRVGTRKIREAQCCSRHYAGHERSRMGYVEAFSCSVRCPAGKGSGKARASRMLAIVSFPSQTFCRLKAKVERVVPNALALTYAARPPIICAFGDFFNSSSSEKPIHLWHRDRRS